MTTISSFFSIVLLQVFTSVYFSNQILEGGKWKLCMHFIYFYSPNGPNIAHPISDIKFAKSTLGSVRPKFRFGSVIQPKFSVCFGSCAETLFRCTEKNRKKSVKTTHKCTQNWIIFENNFFSNFAKIGKMLDFAICASNSIN